MLKRKKKKTLSCPNISQHGESRNMQPKLHFKKNVLLSSSGVLSADIFHLASPSGIDSASETSCQKSCPYRNGLYRMDSQRYEIYMKS